MIVAPDVAGISAWASSHNQRHVEGLQTGSGPKEKVANGVLLVNPLHHIRRVSRGVVRNSLRALDDDRSVGMPGDLTLLESVASEQAIVQRVSAIDTINVTRRGR